MATSDAKRVLIVEDDESIAEMLCDLLKEHGYVTSTCRDGSKVMDDLETDTKVFHAMLLDVLIPHMSGFAIAEKVRASERYKDLPIIMMSGIYRARAHARDMERRFQINDYFDKPLDTTKLVDALERLVPTAGPGPDLSHDHTGIDVHIDMADDAETSDEAELDDPKEAFDQSDDDLSGFDIDEADTTGKHPHPVFSTSIDADTKREKQDIDAAAERHFHTGAFVTQGSLRKIAVPAVLGKLWRTQASGALLMRNERVKKIVYIREGVPYLVLSNRISECLGRVLVRENLISIEDCEESLRRMHATGRKQGEILLEMDVVTPETVTQGLELQYETKLFDTFTWQDGEFRFDQSAQLPAKTIDSKWHNGSVLVEGIRRAFDEERLRKLMDPVLNVPLTFRKKTLDLSDLKFTEPEQKAIAALQLPQHARDLINSVNLKPLHALRLIYTLIALDLLIPARTR